MPYKFKFMSMPRLLAGLLVILSAALVSPALNARDQVQYGRYLGVRLKMYDEAYEVLNKIIKEGKDAEKVRAKQMKAQVKKAEADNEFADDEEKRLALYEEALSEFDLAEKVAEQSPGAVVSKGGMMLELAMSLRRANPEKAREFACGAQSAFNNGRGYRLGGARQILDALRRHLENKVRFAGGNRWAEVYLDYSRMYFLYCKSFYVEAMTYELGSPERTRALGFCENELGEFQFSLDDATEELVLSYALMGDMELARGMPASAAAKFVDVVNFLNGSLPNAYIGRLALEHGYLRAAEIYTTELDFEPENLEKVVNLYAEAYNSYGGFSDLDFMFKRFQLYRISALIKLGDEGQIQGAIDLLFKLAGDSDITFRRQALIVLADIATRENLDNELRFKCAGVVYDELGTNPVSVILKNIQAYQSLLMACDDVKTFETYAPACFTRIGEMYSRMWRFLDAALVYREATYRTVYFREKFGADGKPPAHMLDRCRYIDEAGTPYKFPGLMAEDFARHAGYLVSSTYGDPDNDYFDDLVSDADQLKASLQGLAAQWDLASKEAFELYEDEDYAQAAVKYLSLPAEYRSYHIALFVGAKAYYSLSADENSRRINTRGDEGEVESEEWFAEQRARHEGDLGKLPGSMWQGVETAHWEAIQSADTDGQVANWHKAVYYYKKYFLFEVLKAWNDVKPMLEEIESPTMLDGIGAVASFNNSKWLRENPEGEGEPDANMNRMGRAAYELAYLLRNPPDNANSAMQTEMLNQGRDLAVGLLGPFWDWYGTHLQDSPKYKKGALYMAFYALYEAKDVDGCEQAYQAYSETFPDETANIRGMVTNVYRLMREVLQPKTGAMATVSSVLISRSNLLKKNRFERISAKQFPEDAKKLGEAKTEYEKQLALAEHFWNVWILEKLFEGDLKADIETYLGDVLPALKTKWETLKTGYPRRWADAMRAEFDKRIKSDSFKDVAAEVKKAVGTDTFENNREIVDKLKKLKAGTKDTDKIQKYADLEAYVTVQTSALRYFTGTLFVYEWGGILESAARNIDERSRPVTTRVLKYYEEYLRLSGKQGAGLDAEKLETLGKQYFRIRDWKNVVKYLGMFREGVESQSVSPWGKPESIAVDQRNKTAGKTRSGQELEVKYQLGKAHLELYKENGDASHLKTAALLMRRCWCFNLVRDAKEVGAQSYKLQFQKEIEDYYLYVGRAMSEIFLLIHDSDEDIKVDWPKYHNQYTSTLEQDKDKPLQDVPTTKASYLWEAGQIHLRVWASFTLMSSYQYREEYRYNLEHWLKHILAWVRTYKKDDMGVEQLKGDGLKQALEEAIGTAETQGNLPGEHLPDDMKQYLERVKSLGEQIKKEK